MEAGSKGAANLMGGPAMTDPLQNLIFGIMGADEKALTDRALKNLTQSDKDFRSMH